MVQKFAVIFVGVEKEKYVWGFPSFPETFLWNELYHEDFLPQFWFLLTNEYAPGLNYFSAHDWFEVFL